MRKCWNWQTGMTKDHVVPDREGSSPFFRIIYLEGRDVPGCEGITTFLFRINPAIDNPLPVLPTMPEDFPLRNAGHFYKRLFRFRQRKIRLFLKYVLIEKDR